MKMLEVYTGSKTLSAKEFGAQALSEGYVNWNIVESDGREVVVLTDDTVDGNELYSINEMCKWLDKLEQQWEGIYRNTLYLGDTCCTMSHIRDNINCHASLDDCKVYTAYFIDKSFNDISIAINYLQEGK